MGYKHKEFCLSFSLGCFGSYSVALSRSIKFAQRFNGFELISFREIGKFIFNARVHPFSTYVQEGQANTYTPYQKSYFSYTKCIPRVGVNKHPFFAYILNG